MGSQRRLFGFSAPLRHQAGAADPQFAPARRKRVWQRVLASDEAGAAIEFALVGAPFIALMIAAMNTALVFLAQEGLETAAEGAARLLLTGQAQTLQYYNGSDTTPTTGMTAAQFQNAVCGTLTYNATAGASTQTSFGGTMLPPFLSCSNLVVNVTTASSYSSAALTAPTFTYDSSGNVTATGTGYNVSSSSTGQNLILVVQLIYLWPTTTGPLGFSLSNQANGDDMLVATQVITTENYVCPTGVSVC